MSSQQVRIIGIQDPRLFPLICVNRQEFHTSLPRARVPKSVLKLNHTGAEAVVVFAPASRLVANADQLDGDTNPLTLATNATLDEVVGTQFDTYLARCLSSL